MNDTEKLYIAIKRMPLLLVGNYSPLEHKTVADVLFMAETELSLYEEGEPETDIKTRAQANQVRAYIKFLQILCEVKA
jgi:hypothetical protein